MRSRSPVTLRASLEHNLLAYVAVAGAGVGCIALAQPVAAEVVYTPAEVRIGGNAFTPYDLDVNQDGILDFEFLPHSYAHFDRYIVLYAFGIGSQNVRGNVQLAKDGTHFDAAARNPGAIIGSKNSFDFFTRMGAEHSDFNGQITSQAGSWLDLQRRYLGLQFKINGETHYGWARLNVRFVESNQLIVQAILTGYAYETVPDEPIAAGDTGNSATSLGHLALGAAVPHTASQP
jgi:hypothetical protein